MDRIAESDAEDFVQVDDEFEYELRGSFIEVYNEKCYDLFRRQPSVEDESHRPVLRIKKDCNGYVLALGAIKAPMRSLADEHALLAFGQANRSVEHTNANAQSSRSPAPFSIILRAKRDGKRAGGARLF